MGLTIGELYEINDHGARVCGNVHQTEFGEVEIVENARALIEVEVRATPGNAETFEYLLF
jgi:hypothetical protein